MVIPINLHREWWIQFSQTTTYYCHWPNPWRHKRTPK